MIIKRWKKIVFVNQCDCVFDPAELRKATRWYSNKPVARIKTIYLHGQYPAVSIYDKKIHVHRLLMMYWLQRDLAHNEHIHHMRGKLNCLRYNLLLMSAAAHNRIHVADRVLSTEARSKISAANRLRKGMPHKRTLNVSTEAIKQKHTEGLSINAIARYFGCDRSSIKRRLTDTPHLLEKQA